MTNPIPLGRIASLSAVHNLADLHEQWFKLRQANPSGVASIGDRAAAGNEIFWTESKKVRGIVFLWRPGRVLDALEKMKPARSLEEITDYLLEKNAELYERFAGGSHG